MNEHHKFLPLLKNDNFSKCFIWDTGWEFFYFVEKLCFVLKIFKVLYFQPSHDLLNLWRDVMMSISTWDRMHFGIYLLNQNSLTHQTWSIDRYKKRQYFSEIFWTIWRTGAKFQVLFNLATCSNYSVTNYVEFPFFHFFERVNKGVLKVVNINN